MRRIWLALTLALVISMPVAAQVTRWGMTVTSGAALPGTCASQDLFYLTTGALGTYRCTSTNTWTIFDNVSTPATPIAVAWGALTGTLSNQTDLQSALNGKQASGSYATGTGTANGTNTGDQDLSALAPKASPTFTGTVSGITKAMVGLTNVNDTSDASKPVSTAQQTALDLKANLASPTFTGTVTLPASTSLTTPVLGVATGTSLAVTGKLTSSSATAGIGYATGSGGAQTQATSKATTVVSNTITTAITMNAAALAAGAIVSFTFTNSSIAATDQVVCTHESAGTNGAYLINARPAAGSASIAVRNTTAGSLSEAIVLRCSVYKAVSS